MMSRRHLRCPRDIFEEVRVAAVCSFAAVSPTLVSLVLGEHKLCTCVFVLVNAEVLRSFRTVACASFFV